MTYFPINYNEPLFRPPAEANSLIFQITLGCSWNKCAFCEMYTSKQFKVKKEEEIIGEIKNAASNYPDVRRIFLADGNAMVLSTNKLKKILQAINEAFPKVGRISAYALPKDISSKSMDDLVELRNMGLKLIYVGIESGDDEVLNLVNKGETFHSTVEGLLKAREAGIKNSVMILNGLGGKKYSRQHAINSAKILNEIQPEYASTLVLSFPYGIERFKQRFAGEYVPMNVLELIKEMEIFIENTELKGTIYRSNHASNYLVLKGTLSRDKHKLLKQISEVLGNPQTANLREEWERGL
ncbi:B12-binding domain-containing radical SAM protein [candidate division KSB1 bacterium]|nr:B12-binding domain-containing radical SAM protein [candidate division KSB1 bacterium]MBL7095137.1 B12-binding domain-containing radical SAM protein [candidate division KSB1 bacterium]